MILDQLRTKHAKDLFVEECLMGSAGSPRLDAWAMKRTWSPVTMIGYEIKTSRNDFLRDDKWPVYLEACHQLYFVCPWGLIQPEETPESTGLLWLSKTGSRIYTKRKAPRREIDPPLDLLVHVLMCRTVIVKNMWQTDNNQRTSRQAGAEFWRRWLKEKEEYRHLGKEVRGCIREMYAAVEDENNKLRTLHNSYDRIRDRLREMGFDPEQPISRWNIESRLKEALNLIPERLDSDIRTLAHQLENTALRFGELREKWTRPPGGQVPSPAHPTTKKEGTK